MRIFPFLIFVACSSPSPKEKEDAGYSRAIEQGTQGVEESHTLQDGNCKTLITSKLACIVKQEVCSEDGGTRISATKIDCPKDKIIFPWKDLPDPPR